MHESAGLVSGGCGFTQFGAERSNYCFFGALYCEKLVFAFSVSAVVYDALCRGVTVRSDGLRVRGTG